METNLTPTGRGVGIRVSMEEFEPVLLQQGFSIELNGEIA